MNEYSLAKVQYIIYYLIIVVAAPASQGSLTQHSHKDPKQNSHNISYLLFINSFSNASIREEVTLFPYSTNSFVVSAIAFII